MTRTIIKIVVVTIFMIAVLGFAFRMASEHENSELCKRMGAHHYAHGSCWFEESKRV